MKKVLSIVCLLALTVACLFTMVSCGAPNSDPDEALAALKENGINWAGKDTLAIPTVLKAAGISGVDCVVSGTGKIDEKYAHVTIIYFVDSDSASNAWEKVEERAEEAKKDAGEDVEWVCNKSGKMIYYGTKSAVDAAK